VSVEARQRVRCVGLTGGVASGKSTVAQCLRQLGYAVWDADLFVREVAQWPSVRARIENLLGKEAYSPEGIYQRAIVRGKVFERPDLRMELEYILHPAVAQHFQEKREIAKELAPNLWVFYEASLLLEAGRKNDFDALVLVTAPLDMRLERLQARNGFAPEAAQKIIDAQWSDEKKRALCDFEISNGDGHAELWAQVWELLSLLKARFAPSEH
jgi:dephospho-CoA kinase